MEKLLLIFMLGWSAVQAPPVGWLGITVQELTPQMAARLGVRSGDGVVVMSVQFDSPAKRGGLQEGDVITAINGRKVPDIQTLRKEVSKTTPDTPLQVTIIRERKERVLEIRVGAPPKEAA
ncbi:MAG TPA: PDZ domain-containing protein [Candidatus Manganitrophaceae bacterium]|nr:PDZ domain-containing protein [Candidatus Manganitrophaceae bacterium]